MAKVLLIEDNIDILENTSEILELGGHEVLQVNDGLEGLILAVEQLPDIILCDIQMPVMTGYEVLLNLRAHSTTAKIPFVFVTASVEKKEMQKAFDLGVSRYICKPFEPNELLMVIGDLLEGSKQKTD